MTATDTTRDDLVQSLLADPDFLDTLRAAVRNRAERPFFNMAGDRIGVNPLAATGRVQVAPGQTISSATWGNPVWDQSVNCFASAADRDAQWPSPHDGSVCYTVDQAVLWLRMGGIWKVVSAAIHAGMYRGAAFNVNNTLVAAAPFDTAEPGSTPGMVSGLSTSAARFLITVPGRYLFCASISYAPTVALTMYINLRKNAVNQAQGGSSYSVTGQWGQGPGVSKGILCVAGDYLDVTWQTNNATNSPIQAGLSAAFATVDYLGPTP